MSTEDGGKKPLTLGQKNFIRDPLSKGVLPRNQFRERLYPFPSLLGFFNFYFLKKKKVYFYLCVVCVSKQTCRQLQRAEQGIWFPGNGAIGRRL